MGFVDNIIPTVRKALCDPLPEVRETAAKTFDNLHSTIGKNHINPPTLTPSYQWVDRPTKTLHLSVFGQVELSLGDIDYFSSMIYCQTNITISCIHSRMIALELITTGMYPSTSITINHQHLAERHVQSHHSCMHHRLWQIDYVNLFLFSPGHKALDDILPELLRQLDDEVRGPYALDGLKQVMMVKSRVVLPFLIPKVVHFNINQSFSFSPYFSFLLMKVCCTISSRAERTFNRAWNRCQSLGWTQWLILLAHLCNSNGNVTWCDIFSHWVNLKLALYSPYTNAVSQNDKWSQIYIRPSIFNETMASIALVLTLVPLKNVNINILIFYWEVLYTQQSGLASTRMKLTLGKVDDGIKHLLKYFCMRCFL